MTASAPIVHHLQTAAKRDLWLHATVCGSLWGTLEIVLGSFLHNLRLPFTGTSLAALSVMLLVAFSRRHPTPGLLWRAGLVCALMKSISPSGVIFGPMIGIMLEALAVDLAFRLPGPRLFVSMIGGSLALFSALLQKIIRLLIFYGEDLASLYSSLTGFARRETGIAVFDGTVILVILSLAYLVLGATAARIGWAIGNPAIQRATPLSPSSTTAPAAPRPLRPSSASARLRAPLAVPAHLIVIVFCLFLLNSKPPYLSLPAVSSYVFLVAILYRTATRRILRTKIWLQFTLITALSGIFLHRFTGQTTWSWDGLRTGVDMSLRALTLVAGFAALGCELRNPALTLLTRSPRLKHLHRALETAFALLPRLTENLPPSQCVLRHPIHTLGRWLATVDPLICELRNSAAAAPVWVVTGETGQGKTSTIECLIRQISDSGFRVGGIFTRCVERRQNGPSRYELVACRTGETHPLTAAADADAAIETGIRQHRFSPAAFAWANQRIQAEIGEADMMVIDEIGGLELRGEGFAPGLRACLAARVPCLVAVNTTRLDRLMPLFGEAAYGIPFASSGAVMVSV